VNCREKPPSRAFYYSEPIIDMKQERYPKGHFIGLGIAMGAPFGVPLWLLTDNPGMIGMGVAIGVAIGAAMEEKYNKNPRPLTKQEKKNKKMAVTTGVVLLLVGIVALAALFLAF
jgi:hypothetical protein